MKALCRIALLAVAPLALGCGPGKSGTPVGVAGPAERDERDQSPGSAAAAPREQVENPQYKSWATFPKGTTVVLRSVTRADGHPAVTTTTRTYTLLDLTDAEAVIEMRARTQRYDGVEINNPPEKLTVPKRIALPPGVSKTEFEKPAGGDEQGEETVTVGGKEYKTRFSRSRGRNEAGEVLGQVWSSDAVPGGLVKSVTRTPGVGKTTTIELVEVKTP
jgi:hypothetical protein